MVWVLINCFWVLSQAISTERDAVTLSLRRDTSGFYLEFYNATNDPIVLSDPNCLYQNGSLHVYKNGVKIKETSMVKIDHECVEYFYLINKESSVAIPFNQSNGRLFRFNEKGTYIIEYEYTALLWNLHTRKAIKCTPKSRLEVVFN